MIGYHYSPAANTASIQKHGLLVPLRHPRLTTPVTCSEGHRNPHISLARTPAQAWDLSGGFLMRRARERRTLLAGAHLGWWCLYQVDLNGVRYLARGYEFSVRVDIPKSRVVYVGGRSGMIP
jgi:hypothetical protein